MRRTAHRREKKPGRISKLSDETNLPLYPHCLEWKTKYFWNAEHGGRTWHEKQNIQEKAQGKCAPHAYCSHRRSHLPRCDLHQSVIIPATVYVFWNTRYRAMRSLWPCWTPQEPHPWLWMWVRLISIIRVTVLKRVPKPLEGAQTIPGSAYRDWKSLVPNGIWPMAKVKSPEGRSPGNCMQPRTGQFCCRKLMLTSHLWFSEQRRPWHEPSSAGKHSNHILTSSPGQAEGLTHSHIQSLSGSKNREFRCPVATIKEFQKADLGSLEEINFQESHAMIIGSELCSGKG